MKSIFPSFPYYFQNCFNKRVQFRLDNLLLLLLCMHVVLSHSFGLQYIIFFGCHLPLPMSYVSRFCELNWTACALPPKDPFWDPAFTQCPPLHIALFNKTWPIHQNYVLLRWIAWMRILLLLLFLLLCWIICASSFHIRKNGTFLYNITQHVLNGKFTW